MLCITSLFVLKKKKERDFALNLKTERLRTTQRDGLESRQKPRAAPRIRLKSMNDDEELVWWLMLDGGFASAVDLGLLACTSPGIKAQVLTSVSKHVTQRVSNLQLLNALQVKDDSVRRRALSWLTNGKNGQRPRQLIVPSDDYGDVYEAFEDAADGDTITLASGTYDLDEGPLPLVEGTLFVEAATRRSSCILKHYDTAMFAGSNTSLILTGIIFEAHYDEDTHNDVHFGAALVAFEGARVRVDGCTFRRHRAALPVDDDNTIKVVALCIDDSASLTARRTKFLGGHEMGVLARGAGTSCDLRACKFFESQFASIVIRDGAVGSVTACFFKDFKDNAINAVGPDTSVTIDGTTKFQSRGTKACCLEGAKLLLPARNAHLCINMQSGPTSSRPTTLPNGMIELASGPRPGTTDAWWLFG